MPLNGDDDYGLALCNRRLQDILIFKAVNGMLPEYICDLFVARNNVNCLRGTNKLVVPSKKTLNSGLKSTTFICAKVWNSLRQFFKNRIYGCCENYICNVQLSMIHCNSVRFSNFLIFF